MEEDRNRLLEGFFEEEKLKGKSPYSLLSLRSRVRKLFRYLDESSLTIDSVRYKEASGYQGWLIETGKKDGNRFSPKTILGYMGTASGFYDYLKLRGIVVSNPFKRIKRIRIEKKVPGKLLKEKEMEILLNELSEFDTPLGRQGKFKEKMAKYRTHLIAELQYSTGLRIGEAALLKVEDIDFDKGIVHVRRGKGGKPRIAFLNDYAKEVLRLYTDKVRKLLLTEQNDSSLLFGVNWRNLGSSVNDVLADTCKKTKLTRITSHGFRHAVGYHLLKNGCGIRHIQAILGHDCIKSTEIYTKVDKEDLRNILDVFHPRKWNKR